MICTMCVLLYITIFIFNCVYCQNFSPLVTIPDGQLRGTVNRTVGQGKIYYAYKGIPFAKSPIGNLRFAPPIKNDPWNGILNATSDRDICTQLPLNLTGNQISNVEGSEDCLYISVYTTNLNSSLPVMVWIYGGIFLTGSSTSAGQPDYLLDEDVIFVSFNYRLGVFGFLSTEDLASPGNWGLKDQVLALNWVKNNIRYFGGDPNKITAFGESAGAVSLSYLTLSTSHTAGLYRGAIMQSGTALNLWGLSRNNIIKAFRVGRELGILTTNTKTLITYLRQVNYRELKVAENKVTLTLSSLSNLLAGLPFGVVQEPEHPGAVVTGSSHQKLSSGNFNRIPTIIGFNSFELTRIPNEFTLIKNLLLPYDVTSARLAPYDLSPNFINRTFAGEEIRKRYFPRNPPIGSNLSQFRKFATVDQFDRPVREAVSLMAGYSDVFYYELSYEGILGSPNKTYQGVAHAEDLNYIFYRDTQIATPEDLLTRSRIITMWTNFAKTLNPTPTNVSDVLQSVTWIPNTPKINTSSTVYYLNINESLSVLTNPVQEEWNFYRYIYRKYGVESYYTTY